MNKIEEIFKSWGISINPNEEQSKLASDRIQICNTCEHKKEGIINTCGICGCSLRAKVFSPVFNSCPIGKWEDADTKIGLKRERTLRFLCAQPATTYYVWQVEIMLNNFMEMGVNPNHIDIVSWMPDGIVPEQWSKLAENYSARFFFYKDTRKTKHYISSIRPNILKQHFKNHPYLKNESIFYHDCDILFTHSISKWITNEMITDDNWYGSDTRWYIAHSYIKSKGEDVLNKMCEIVGIDIKVVEDNELNSIGAQYLMKDVDEYYWDRVEIDSERLYKEITELNNEKVMLDKSHTMSPDAEKRQPYHPLQIWCADMWAVLWNAWKLDKKTICSPNMQFSWATSGIDEYHKFNIFHNAGVTSNDKDLFSKSKYVNKLPFGEELVISEKRASSEYVKWIKKIEKKSVLL
jgi:hypothetical protein